MNDLVTEKVSTESIDRGYVLHRNDDGVPATILRIRHKTNFPSLSVIIPTRDAFRDGLFIKLIDQIYRQVFKSFEVLIVCGDQFQGRSINYGAAISQGKYLITLDDDTSLPDPGAFKKLVAVLETHPDVALAGGNNTIPAGASSFVRRVMKEIPRRSWNPVKTITDSDLAEHPCMIMRTDEFKAIGGENELIPRGLDPYLREQFRKRGKRVVVVPDVIYHHLPPNTLSKLLKQFYRNGRQAAYTNLFYPQWVIETPADHGTFRFQVPFSMRILRFPLRAMGALATGKPLWFLAQVAYGLGFVREYLRYRTNPKYMSG